MPYSGLFLVLDEDRRNMAMREWGGIREGFSEALSVADWEGKPLEVAFFSLNSNEINGVGLLKRGNRVVTGKNKYTVTTYHNFGSIPLSMLEQTLPQRIRPHFIRSSSGIGRRMPDATWRSLIDAITTLNQEYGASVNRLLRLREEMTRGYSGAGWTIVGLERDALNLALSAFNADKNQILLNWTPPSSPAPFMAGLRHMNVIEDQMIAHDSHVLDDKGWQIVMEGQGYIVQFERGNERLTVINANRNPIETTLGVDLVYYDHTHDSYIMVQYKRMQQTSDENSSAVYYPRLDHTFSEEYQRMSSFIQANPVPSTFTSSKSYRLNANPFYFKFCPKVILNPTATTMINGMYLSLDYFDCFRGSPESRGRRGAECAVRYDSPQKHYNNTQFVSLFQQGWIGSSMINTRAITEIINRALQSDKSLLIAESSRIERPELELTDGNRER
jgi:hypothetical protein